MDIITHIALGACMGEAMLGPKTGKEALAWGALAHSFPDVDVVSALWLNTPEGLLSHRGITHSVTGAILAVCLFSRMAVAISKKVKTGNWIMFFSLTVFMHPLLDAFNTYGVGWFEPFSNQRISFNSMYVADPLFSIMPICAAIYLLLSRNSSHRRKLCWRVAFITSSVYLLVGVLNKIVVGHAIEKSLKQQGIAYNRYFTTPAPFQHLLWFTVAENDSGFYTAYRSVFDRSPVINFHFVPSGKKLLESYHNQREVELLTRFSQDWYSIEEWHDTLVFNDLRFGQEAGWYDSTAPFCFHYYLGNLSSNRLVMQRGRMQGWNNRSVSAFFRKIAGY